MPPPRITDPHTARMLILGVLRLSAVVLICWGLIQVGGRLTFGLIAPGAFSDAWRTWQGIGEEHGMFRGLPMLIVGTALAGLSRPIAWWVICAPERGCPRCGHDTSGTGASGTGGARCSECGYQLG